MTKRTSGRRTRRAAGATARKVTDWAEPTKPIYPKEHAEQVSVLRLIRLAYPKLRPYVYATPNGGSRHHLEAINLKNEGVSKGYPDLGLDVPRGTFHGLRIEMKRDKRAYKGLPSAIGDEQYKWGDRLTSMAH